MDMKHTTTSTEPKAEPVATPPQETGASAPLPGSEQPARRGRRPRNAAPPLTETQVGVEPGDAPQDAKPTRKRRAKVIDSDALAKQLKGIHKLAAQMVPISVNGKPLLELSDDESQQLAQAVAAVANEYDLELDGKTGAAI